MLHVAVTRTDASQRSDILYAKKDLGGWHDPVDIVAALPGQSVWPERLAAHGTTLYMLWIASGDGVYLSKAPLASTDAVTTWDRAWVTSEAISADLIVHDGDHLAVAYIDRSYRLWWLFSSDGGASWPEETLIWSPPSISKASRNVRIVSDGQGTYHIVWTETDAALDWNPSGIWYARSLDQGQTWQDYCYIPEQGSYVNVAVDADAVIHLLWNRNVGTVDGRYHAMSLDGGQTWTEPSWIMKGLSGRTGYPRMVLDRAGVLHQLTAGQGLGRRGAIYHSTWSGEAWGPSELVSPDEKELGYEGPALALTNGNILHAVWLDWSSADLMYSSRRTAAPYVEGLPLSVLSIATPTPSSRPSLGDGPALASPDVFGQIVTGVDSSEIAAVDRPPTIWSSPLALGTASALMVVTGVLSLLSWTRRDTR